MNESAPIPPENHRDLIESIYRIALEPQSYDDFMDQWDSFIAGQVSALNALQDDALAQGIDTGEVANHFALAMQLLEQSGRPDPDDTPAPHRPQIMLSGTGAIVWVNAAAGAAFGLRSGMTLDDLDVSAAHRADIAALLAGRRDGIVLVQIAPRDGTRPVPMSVQSSSRAGNETLFMASALRQSWPPATDGLLERGFDLSQSEIAVCALLSEGLGAAEIAARRDSATGTVRKQIQAILKKTDSAGQVELVSLLHATMRLAEKEGALPVPKPRAPDTVLNIATAGRIMPVEIFGDPRGTPVIFFHGMLDGNTMTPRLRALLEEHGYCLYSPVRPHFGTAEPDESGPIQTAPARFSRDIETLLDRESLTRPILLGHMGGALYAFAAAARLGERVRGILSVSGAVPLVSARQLAAMSARQRVVALTARYTPRMLPFVVRAGIAQLDNKGGRQFMEQLYRDCPEDLRVASDPEVRDLLNAGYRFTVAQGHRAFEIDSYHVVRDWSATAESCTQPVTLVHGTHDPVISPASVDAFHQRLGPRAALTMLEDTGQLILYRTPEAVIAALDRLRAGPARSAQRKR